MSRLPIIALVLLLMAFRCHQDYPCASQSYVFGVDGHFAPASASVTTGDTVLFESSFSKVIYDSVTSGTINYNGSKGIEGSLEVYRIDTVHHRFSTDSFSVRFVPLEGTFSSGSGTAQRFLFGEDPSAYQARVGLLISTPGIYVVHASDLISNGLQGQDCGSASFLLHVPQPAASIALFSQAMGRPPAGGEDELYCFRVR
jgi:hypothetical protein